MKPAPEELALVEEILTRALGKVPQLVPVGERTPNGGATAIATGILVALRAIVAAAREVK